MALPASGIALFTVLDAMALPASGIAIYNWLNSTNSHLAGIIGSEEVVAELIKVKQEMTTEQVKALVKFFHVKPSLFI